MNSVPKRKVGNNQLTQTERRERITSLPFSSITTSMKRIKYYFTAILLLACLSGCGEEETESIDTSKEASSIESLVNEGSLLKEITQDEQNYTFVFETETVEILADKIASVHKNPEEWNTELTFVNKQQLSIPTLGTHINNSIQTVTLNPSGYNPLAATVFATFPVKGRAKIIVHGKEGSNGTVEYLFQNYAENQPLTILGLYADYANKVSIIMTDREGNERVRMQTTIQTAPLDISVLPTYIKVNKSLADKMEPGMTLLNDPGSSEADTSCPYMLDADGEIRWVLDWRTSPELLHIGAQCGLFRMKNGNYLVGDANNYQIAEVDILGKMIRRWDLKALGYSFHHEVSIGENGMMLVSVSKLDATLNNGKPRIFDHIIEMSSNEGTVTREWDLVTMLDSSRYTATDPSMPGASSGQSQENWAHQNAIQYWGEDLLTSARFQGVFKFSKNGELAWIISPHKNWRPEYRKHLLTPLDKNGNKITDPQVISGEKSAPDFDWPWGQHTPVLLPNGHILVFDNGYARHFVAKPFMVPGQYSRVVEYEVDETNKTVRQIWAFGTGQDKWYAPAFSSVQYLPETGHVLFCPGMGNKLSNGSYGAHIIEVDPKTNEIVFEVEILTTFHRVTRLCLYPEGM